jgi:hypothetical protein
MFYRPGGYQYGINRQYDEVYADFIGGSTDFLPVSKGDWIAINVCRSSISYVTPAASIVTKETTAPEVQVVLEMKTIGGQKHAESWPIDQWQNLVVATGLRAHRNGWVRLRILNINNLEGVGVSMALQISRSGDSGIAA